MAVWSHDEAGLVGAPGQRPCLAFAVARSALTALHQLQVGLDSYCMALQAAAGVAGAADGTLSARAPILWCCHVITTLIFVHIFGASAVTCGKRSQKVGKGRWRVVRLEGWLSVGP